MCGIRTFCLVAVALAFIPFYPRNERVSSSCLILRVPPNVYTSLAGSERIKMHKIALGNTHRLRARRMHRGVARRVFLLEKINRRGRTSFPPRKNQISHSYRISVFSKQVIRKKNILYCKNILWSTRWAWPFLFQNGRVFLRTRTYSTVTVVWNTMHF